MDPIETDEDRAKVSLQPSLATVLCCVRDRMRITYYLEVSTVCYPRSKQVLLYMNSCVYVHILSVDTDQRQLHAGESGHCVRASGGPQAPAGQSSLNGVV